MDLKHHWQRLIDMNAAFEYPDCTISDWKRAVFEGKTRRGYAEIVSTYMMENRLALPEILKQFKPKGNFGKAVKEAAIEEFEREGYIQVVKANGHGWFVMRYAFENLVPFIVAKTDDSFIVAKDTSENRSDLRELAAEILYEFDGYAMPVFENL